MNANNGWADSSTISSTNGLCEFKNGTYTAQSDQPDWCSASTNYATFALEVQMAIVRGQEGGILFDLNADNQTFYYFHITTDGHCIVARSDGPGNVSPPRSIDCHSTIKTGQNQQNIIAVLANGSNIDLYVNKVGVMVIPNDVIYTSSGTYYQHGAIACNVNSYNNGEQVTTEVHYSNLKIWQP